jgi:CheY-like chemotaxis protein/pSer/pThr/pTyr-binding forkhead associated (FHA) protein
MPLLHIKLADQGKTTHELTAPCIRVGRKPDNTVQIIDRSVSGYHAELIFEDGHYRLHDLGSTNLTFVDGKAVTDFHLRHPCKITFGTVQCEFDPHEGSRDMPLPPAVMEKDLAFLRGENSELQGKLAALQRQIDILSSARLFTKKSETTPMSASNDALKAAIAERDDLRHLNTGLKLELERMREELAATARERDAARQTCELLQAEKVTHWREVQERRASTDSAPGATAAEDERATTAQIVLPPPPQSMSASSPASGTASPTATLAASSETIAVIADKGTTQKLDLSPAPASESVARALAPVRTAIERLTQDPAQPAVLAELSAGAGRLLESTHSLGEHPIVRLAFAVEAMLHDLSNRTESPDSAHLRTLAQATELISRLLEPDHLARTQNLTHPRVLAVDDDADLLQTLKATLELANLPTIGCADSREAQALVETDNFDLLLLDVQLPDLDGATLCGQIRENDRYRKTPVIFLTVADTLNHRAQASLNGGNDFLPKPFNSAELTVKAETWIWKSRFGLM